MRSYKFIIGLAMVSACTTAPADLSEKAKQEIISSDIAMSDLAVKDGFHKTLLDFAADSLVKPQEGQYPVIGKAALEKYWSDKEDTKQISWKPFKAEASSSGDLGYSLGHWTFAAPDSTLYGFYYTIWKKQDDGKWKWIVDGGNNTPAPK